MSLLLLIRRLSNLTSIHIAVTVSDVSCSKIKTMELLNADRDIGNLRFEAGKCILQ